jgi:hypothetical protein
LDGAVVWVVNGGWEMIAKIEGRFCKKVPRRSRSTANGAAEWELSRESRKVDKMLYIVVKYLVIILLVEEDELLKCCFEWQRRNLKCDNRVISLREEWYKIGLEYIWLDREGGIQGYMSNNTNCV